MSEKLQAAIISLAEYEGKTVSQSTDGFYGSWEQISYIMKAFQPYNYHKSADALLPVWRKVGKEHAEHKLVKWGMYSASSHERVGTLILDGNYEQACIQLAEIIEQLKSNNEP